MIKQIRAKIFKYPNHELNRNGGVVGFWGGVALGFCFGLIFLEYYMLKIDCKL